VSFDSSFVGPGRIRSGWNTSALLRRGFLTDRKIEQYRKAGWYSEAYRTARRELMDKKQKQREAREGGFVRVEGRLIYAP
jgi:hypothetical protein